jgi:hypothetical protein
MYYFGKTQYTVDRDATVEAYRRADSGFVDNCDCSTCRNFRLARDEVFPVGFKSLLHQLGIDPNKGGEVYHNGEIGRGLHDYGGWFHLVGRLLNETEAFSEVGFGETFTAWMCSATAPRLTSLEDLKTVQLEFHASAVPWILDEPEPV